MKLKNCYIISCILLLILAGCKSDDDDSIVEQVVVEKESTSILFIGNSHTNFNGGIDNQVNAFAQSVDLASDAERTAPNGFTLQDHLNSQTTLDAIDRQTWDYIILQENTYRAAYEAEEMLESISQFTDLLQSKSATIYLFKTWAYDGEPEMNALLDEAYFQASALSGYSTVAIGSYWKTFQATNDVNLYSGDSVHPNENGTYLSAGLFFKKIFNYPNLNEVPNTAGIEPNAAEIIRDFISNQNI